MVRLYTILILLSWYRISHAQGNLVPNPSFEDTINCSKGYITANIEKAEHWYSPSSGSSDLWVPYSNCAYYMSGIYPYHQQPFHGQNHAGIIAYTSGEAREYIAVKLLDSLQATKEYCVSFRIIRRSSMNGAIDTFGAYFDADSIHIPTHYALPLIPQIESPVGMVITDTLHWTTVSGSFIANGGEKFMAIGNFRDNANTTYTYPEPVFQDGDITMLTVYRSMNAALL